MDLHSEATLQQTLHPQGELIPSEPWRQFDDNVEGRSLCPFRGNDLILEGLVGVAKQVE
jgi:hypothetical protein